MKTKLTLTIAIPTYNGEDWIADCLNSIFKQSFSDFKIKVFDDCSTDKTLKIIRSFKDKRIKIYKNKKNLGYAKNLYQLRKHIKSDILFLMAQDDLLLKNALLKTYKAFSLDKNIGAVTRPFFWFDKDPKKPVRIVTPYNKNKDSIISIFDGEKETKNIFGSIGQLSGLAYKTKLLKTDFHPHTFVSHIYPFAEITKNKKIAFLKNYTVAVRIESSQTRHKSSIYNISPLKSWVTMFKSIYSQNKYSNIKEVGIKNISRHYLGLLQIKNFGKYSQLLKEIYYHIKYYPLSLLRIDFWFISLITIIVPKKVLVFLVDNFKKLFLAKTIKKTL
ncbi:glycosyltransferase [Patescibacteria group bacterium]